MTSLAKQKSLVRKNERQDGSQKLLVLACAAAALLPLLQDGPRAATRKLKGRGRAMTKRRISGNGRDMDADEVPRISR